MRLIFETEKGTHPFQPANPGWRTRTSSLECDLGNSITLYQTSFRVIITYCDEGESNNRVKHEDLSVWHKIRAYLRGVLSDKCVDCSILLVVIKGLSQSAGSST
eukprot:scaffold16091_cov132-Skeletonema_dohrnii-CCMP3373.AAC.3